MSETLYGYYSEKQRKALGGFIIYLSEDGQKVQVTEVSTNPVCPSEWSDIQSRGKVTKFVWASPTLRKLVFDESGSMDTPKFFRENKKLIQELQEKFNALPPDDLKIHITDGEDNG